MVEHLGWYSDKKVLSPPPCRLIFHAAVEKNLNDIQVIRHIQWQNVILSTKENKIFSFSSGKFNTILYFCVYILYFDIKKSFPHGWCGFVIKTINDIITFNLMNFISASTEPRSPRPPEVRYRVGQVIRHKIWGYRGVIVAWDPQARVRGT